MFANSYRSTFQTLGVRLGDKDACPIAELIKAEKRLAIKIPDSLKDYYLVAGREKRINQTFNRLLPPDKLYIESGNLVFMEENQNVVFWGVPAVKGVKSDSSVFQAENVRDKEIEWLPQHTECSTFLNVMVIWHASFGGASANTAVGYVSEKITRNILDKQWQLVGEINSMRAYCQPARAVCFLKWEDPIQKLRKLPEWRLFAVAASEAEMTQLKVSLKAQWEEWGG